MRNRYLPRALRALLFTSSLVLLSLSLTNSAPAQHEPPQVCVDYCRQQLYNCFAQNGVDSKKCEPVYRRCLGQCKP